MGLWGASTSDESKPKNLTAAEKKNVFANSSGWVKQAGTADSGNDNTSATPEVLVAIGDLSTSLGNATIDAVNFQVGQTVSGAGGSVLKVEVNYNEQVTVATALPCHRSLALLAPMVFSMPTDCQREWIVICWYTEHNE